MLISVFASKKTGRIHVLTPDSTGERRSRRGRGYQEARRPTISCDVPQTQVMSLQDTSIHVYNDDQPLERFLSGCSGFSHRWSCASAMLRSTCYVKELMSVRDVWVPQNSYTHAVPGQVHAHSYIIYHVCTLYMNIMYGGTCIHTYTTSTSTLSVCPTHLVSVLRWHMTQVAGQWERTERIGLSKEIELIKCWCN